jgi:signal transduction histidine kinase
MARVLGATEGVLATPLGSGHLEVAERPHAGAPLAPGKSLARDADHPLAEAFRTGSPVYLEDPAAAGRYAGLDARPGAVLATPVVLLGRTLGAMAFAFAAPRAFAAEQRALVDDLARQTAVALDRSRLYDHACDANRRKDEFIAVLGHELRNPLAPITTALEIMRLRGDPAFAAERAIIERQVRHMSRLVDDLLDVSRVTRGKLELRREPVELGAVVERAIEMASPLFEQGGHHVTVDVPRRGLVVDADPVRLAQAIGNLLNNAAKYTDAGGTIAVTVRRAGQRVRIAVRDSGIGMAPETLARLFEPFVQGERTLRRAQGGLGLGLALVKSLVEMHRGLVTGTSEGFGRGSEFVIDLPLAADEAQEQPRPRLRPRADAGPRRRVLVVDDNPDAAEGLARLLAQVGHEVKLAYDGPGALAAARTFPFDVAVLDLGLPAMDGYELAARLREEAGGRELRLIAVTGYGSDQDRQRSRASGFDAHFTKPVESDKLLRMIGCTARSA